MIKGLMCRAVMALAAAVAGLPLAAMGWLVQDTRGQAAQGHSVSYFVNQFGYVGTDFGRIVASKGKLVTTPATHVVLCRGHYFDLRTGRAKASIPKDDQAHYDRLMADINEEIATPNSPIHLMLAHNRHPVIVFPGPHEQSNRSVSVTGHWYPADQKCPYPLSTKTVKIPVADIRAGKPLRWF